MTTKQETGASDLDALARQGDMIDGQAAAMSPEAQIEAQEEIEALDLISETVGQVKMLLQLAVPLLGVLYPSLPGVYTPATIEGVSQAVAPVLVKHGINLSDFGMQYKEEIACFMVCAPVAMATVQAVKSDIAARQAAAKATKEKPGKPSEAMPVEPQTDQVVTLG